VEGLRRADGLLGGEIQGRLIVDTNTASKEKAESMGVDFSRIYKTDDLAPGEHIIFAACGVTKGNLPLTMSALSQAPVIAVFSHVGFQDAADGASHQATTYFSALSSIPHTVVVACSCADEAESLMFQAIKRIAEARNQGKDGESVIFFVGRENYPVRLLENATYPWGKAQVVSRGTGVTIVASGPMVGRAIEAGRKLTESGIGATVIPISGGNTERQLMVMADFGVTAICCTPSYFLHLIESAKEMNIDFSRVRVGVFGAEPWSEAMRDRIQAESGIKAHDIYGLSEIIGPGVGVECAAQHGVHIFEDHFFPEIIDPESGAVLPDGEEGELVLTTLSKQAMPMIRYRTRDVTSIMAEPCECGRTIRRIRRISRRSDDMFIIRGVNVFPSQVETALLRVEGTLPHYQIVLTRDRGLDQMEVKVEVTPEVFSDAIRKLEALQHHLEASIENILGLRVKVTLVEPRTLARSEGKARRVSDLRNV